MDHIKNKKTIFFSIPDDIIFKNFASFSGSVLDILSEDPDVRIIAIFNKGQVSEARSLKGNLVIEEIDEVLSKNPLQRAFSFFYSYLIFTKTTRLVSSYGVRSDKPRPLIRYYNYPLKIFIANVFGKSQWIRDKVVPALYMRIFSNYRPYKQLFEKYKPDLVFTPSVCLWPADLELLVESRRQGTKTLGMPGNWDHLSKYYIPFKPDKLLVWSSPVKDEASRYQFYDPNTVEIVGAPQVDFLAKKENLMTRGEFLAKHNFPLDSIIITYASQGPYSIDGSDYVDMMLKWIEEGKLDAKTRIIVRRHPKAMSEKGMYEHFRDNPLISLDSIEYDSIMEGVLNFTNTLGHSDVIVTTYSSIATDSSIWDKPVIITSFDGYKKRPMHQSVRRHRNFTHFQDVIKTGGVKITESPEEFLTAIQEYAKDPLKDAIGRERLRKAVFGFFDGASSARVCKKIKESAGII